MAELSVRIQPSTRIVEINVPLEVKSGVLRPADFFNV
jgi:hypothetical protein